MERIQEIIKEEDKKNPYTDQQLAEILLTTRVKVISERNRLKIPDSRDRRRECLLRDLKEILKSNSNISERKLTEIMNERGYDISRNIVARNLKELTEENINLVEANTPNIKSKENPELNPEFKEDNEGFKKLIGFNGSLKNKIDLAKAAILYPPNGLHTLIYGSSGVGKTELVECMYEFAIANSIKPKDSPFIVFNCADYAENPNLLISQLFGVMKGAYTGANVDKEGLVEKANGGILFLDEIHRLPPEGQEILFYLIDKGKYRRLGETTTERKVTVLIIGATTENPESNLLLTFRRRIPMLIELPKLIDRPLSEKLEIITMFLCREGQRVNRNLLVTKEVIISLMAYNCHGNIGQLKSDIQVICAKAYIKYMSKNTNELLIDVEDLSKLIKSSFLKGNKVNKTIMNLVTDDLYINVKDGTSYKNEITNYVNNNEIYHYIENQFQNLEEQGLSNKEIDEILLEKVQEKIGKIIDNKSITKVLNMNELKSIVRPEVINITERILEIVRDKYKFINNSFFIALAIHINFTIERVLSGRIVKKSNIDVAKKVLPQEFIVAEKIRNVIEDATNLNIPKDETGYIALYINKFCSDELDFEPKVRVIIISHGRVAEGMAEVVNQLLGIEDTIGIEVYLDESPESALKRSTAVVKSVDEGKGCLLLVDMGSLGGFGNAIEESTGIRVKTISRVDTLMALEAVRKASIEGASLDNIVEKLNECKVYDGTFDTGVSNKNKKKAIVTICLTGDGNALMIKKQLENYLKKFNIEVDIFSMGFINKEDIEEGMKKLSLDYTILAICGTINPKVGNTPFISYESILSGNGIDRLSKLMDIYTYNEEVVIEESLEDLIHEDLIFLDLEGVSKEDVIDKMVEKLEKNGYVNNKYLLSIYKREAMGSGIFNNKVAIPHGLPENVIKPAIAIAKLNNPIYWEGEIMVDFVMMLALKENNRNEIRKLFNILREEKVLEEVYKAKSIGQLKKMFS